MKFTLLSKKSVTEDVVSFVFESEQPVAWQPGQYFHYVLPHTDADDRGTERWFTNSAAPSEGHVTISTRLANEGGSSFKQALDNLPIGGQIEADGPEGDFVVGDFSRNYIFVAGGIGITPIRSILTQAAHDGAPLKATLLYANRNDDIPFKEELDVIAADNPNVTVKYVVDPEMIDGNMVKRYVDAVDNPVVYISGPEPMVASMVVQLVDLGMSKDKLKTDDFPGYEAI